MAEQNTRPRIPFAADPQNRDETTAKDARLVNAYVEKLKDGGYAVYRRPGLKSYVTLSGQGRGAYTWQGDIYFIFGTTFYRQSGGVTSSVGTIAAGTSMFRFSSTLGATPSLFLQDGTNCYSYTVAGGLVTLSTVPTPVVRGQVYLDGTTYVMQPSGAAIRGSGLNDLTTWNSNNLILAQIESDNGVSLAKQMIYVVALKEYSVEIFYDAGNSVGSPLGAVQGSKLSVGCIDEATVQTAEGVLFWLGRTRAARVFPMQMENLQAHPIGTPAVDRLFQGLTYTSSYSWLFGLDGHLFYGITVPGANITLVYDSIEKQWSQWTDPSGNYFPIVSATTLNSTTAVLQHETNGKLYTISSTQYSDDGAVIPVDIYTPNIDLGTKVKKYLGKLDFVADQVQGSFLQVRVNDFDYNPSQWSSFRTVDLGQKYPSLIKCGTFRRRAWHFRHAVACPFRLMSAEMQVELGAN